MNPIIVQKRSPVTLVGAGEGQIRDLTLARGVAPEVVAVDGGAELCRDAGVTPLAVIGDLDSLSSALRSELPDAMVHQIDEQDSTDFDKALRSVQAPLLLGVGFLGARLDHALAVLSVLAARPDRRVLLIGPDDVVFHAPPSLSLDLEPDTRISLFPLTPVSGRSQGLVWPIDGLMLDPMGQIGTSNRATGPVHLECDGPGIIVLLPKRCFSAAAQALRAAQPWHAPAR